jgi:hypothetical protein
LKAPSFSLSKRRDVDQQDFGDAGDAGFLVEVFAAAVDDRDVERPARSRESPARGERVMPSIEL